MKKLYNKKELWEIWMFFSILCFMIAFFIAFMEKNAPSDLFFWLTNAAALNLIICTVLGFKLKKNSKQQQ